MSLNNPDRRREKIELFTQTIFQMPPEREMQSRFAAGRENDKGRRAHTRLRYVLHMQPRALVG
ncbi:MAG TPA: hypothetical protein VLN44_00250, partial [Pyrinomonadaceae bacterium]|nr:hypothetical protein [Pyrinomonadaceae bacterium]